MSPRVRKTAAVVTSAVLVVGGGVAAAAAATGNSAKRSKQQVPYGMGFGMGYGAPGHGPGGDHGPGRGGLPPDALASIAKTLGVTTDQLQSAVEAARPTGKLDGAHDRGDIAQELADALNVDAAKVRSILEANRPTPPEGGQGYGPGAGLGGPRGGHPDGGRPGFDDSALIAALATGLNIDQATVKAAFEKLAAAHEADHGARENAFFAAVAKALGLDASAVQKAFEAARPAPPATPGG
jgi:hypothetical protein